MENIVFNESQDLFIIKTLNERQIFFYIDVGKRGNLPVYKGRVFPNLSDRKKRKDTGNFEALKTYMGNHYGEARSVVNCVQGFPPILSAGDDDILSVNLFEHMLYGLESHKGHITGKYKNIGGIC